MGSRLTTTWWSISADHPDQLGLVAAEQPRQFLKADQITARLIVRRVRRLDPVAECATGSQPSFGSRSAPYWPREVVYRDREWAQDLTPAVRLRLSLGRASLGRRPVRTSTVGRDGPISECGSGGP